jgi:hypothetical protein
MDTRGVALNGFTKDTLLTLTIQKELKLNSDGDTSAWYIGEDNTNLSFKRDDVEKFVITPDGDVTISGDLIVGGSIGGINKIEDGDATTSITTTATAETLIFKTNSNERMTIDSSGVVDINNSLNVNGALIKEFGGGFVGFKNDGASSTAFGGFTQSSNGGLLIISDGSNSIDILTADGSNNTDRRMYINGSTGFINIGTNQSPSHKLTVQGDIKGTDLEIVDIVSTGIITGTTMTASAFVGINETSPDAFLHINWTKDSDGLKEMIKLSWDDAGVQDTLAGDGTKISFYTSSVNNAPGSVEAAYVGASRRSGAEANLETELIFATNDGTNLIERLRVSHDGELHMFGQSSTTAAAFHIRKEATATTLNEFIEFYRSATSTGNGTLEGNIRTDGGGFLAFLNASSKKLKKNIKDNKEQSLSVMKNLRSVEFDWIEDEKPNECLGFIAEEVEEVYPNATGILGMHKDEDGNVVDEGVLGISLISLIPVMWSVIKSNLEKIENLETELLKN